MDATHACVPHATRKGEREILRFLLSAAAYETICAPVSSEMHIVRMQTTGFLDYSEYNPQK